MTTRQQPAFQKAHAPPYLRVPSFHEGQAPATALRAPGGESPGPHWQVVRATQAVALIDAENYYRAFYHAALAARDFILIAAWQFDMNTTLLRGDEARRASHPTSLWKLLRRLCKDRPTLRVYVLAWDYSFVYLLERTWLLSLRARLVGSARQRIAWRPHPDASGSHHQKFVVIDHHLVFSGGMDFGEARWDRRNHALDEPNRWDSLGLSRPPFHDVQCALAGPAVSPFVELFQSAWAQATGEQLDLRHSSQRSPQCDLATELATACLTLPSAPVGLSRTCPPDSPDQATEVRNTYAELIQSAETLIYIETQYFTSEAVRDALVARCKDSSRPSLCVVMMMPDAAESGKERLVLGDQQQRVISAVRRAAHEGGHAFSALCSAAAEEGGTPIATYIHSKVMIIDDRCITIGSANLTNRSMTLDSELDLTWRAAVGPDPDVQRVRCSLLAEHAGVDDVAQFEDIDGLMHVISRLVDSNNSKLRPLPTWEVPGSGDELLSVVFDPCSDTEALNTEEVDDEREARRRPATGLWQRLVRTIRRRF